MKTRVKDIPRLDLCVKSKTRTNLIFSTLIELKVVFSTLIWEKSSTFLETCLVHLGFLINLHGSKIKFSTFPKPKTSYSALANDYNWKSPSCNIRDIKLTISTSYKPQSLTSTPCSRDNAPRSPPALQPLSTPSPQM